MFAMFNLLWISAPKLLKKQGDALKMSEMIVCPLFKAHMCTVCMEKGGTSVADLFVFFG